MSLAYSGIRLGFADLELKGFHPGQNYGRAFLQINFNEAHLHYLVGLHFDRYWD